MTILEPKKTKSRLKLKLLFIPAFLIIFAGTFFSISIYNQTVELSHKFSGMEKELNRLEVKNAELKNKVYSLSNPEKIKEIVLKSGLVLDKNPSFLNFKAKESLSEKIQ